MSKFSFLLAGLMVGGTFTTGLLTGQPANAQAVFGNSGDSRENAQNGKLRDPSEFSREQSQQISGAANSFKAEQLRRLQAQQAKPKQN
jgi:hypothetical protein